jgi:hypothetical protein
MLEAKYQNFYDQIVKKLKKKKSSQINFIL